MVLKTLNLGENVQTKNNHAARAARLFFFSVIQPIRSLFSSVVVAVAVVLAKVPYCLLPYHFISDIFGLVYVSHVFLPGGFAALYHSSFFLFPLLPSASGKGNEQSSLICPTTWMRHPWLLLHFNMSPFLSCNGI